MFAEIELKQAIATKWDVIIAGSSFSAMFFLMGLPRGLNVLVVERGNVIPWNDQVFDRKRPAENLNIKNLSDHGKTFQMHTLFGGNSNCWWGQTPRFHPNDFQMKSRYGVAEDWPYGYETLEPFYNEVETVMQIAGGGSEAILPRSAPFPYPPHRLSLTDKALIAARPDIWVPVPTARANGGDRPTCCANGICQLCPIDAKFTVLNSVGSFARPEAVLLTGAEVKSVQTSGGLASGVIIASSQGETELFADTVALGTNGFFNAAILLRSGLGGHAVGRYLHEQASVTVSVDIDQKNYFGGSSITSHCYGAYDGDHRRDSAAVLIENYNAPTRLRVTRGRWTERMNVKLIAEDIPNANNRVVLSEDGTPMVEWVGHSEYAIRGLERAEAKLPEFIPFNIEKIHQHYYSETEAHIQGTHRMGSDPETSVTNSELRLHNVPNLLALGSGSFPSCSPSNPTLTLSAMALRAGRSL